MRTSCGKVCAHRNDIAQNLDLERLGTREESSEFEDGEGFSFLEEDFCRRSSSAFLAKQC